jgi:site-specific DNA-methyltransferase (adenine-specific)
LFRAARGGGGVTLRVEHGDSREVLKALPDASVDSCVCDPPYSLVSIVKRFGADNAAPAKSEGASGVYKRASAGFMGKRWDTGETAFSPDFWREVYRVLKPGAHLVAMSGTRTYHRLASAIEDAGFEVRDQLAWMYGSGFPKSHNAGNGWGTAIKPAWEPICLARKPLVGTVVANMAEHGTGALNIDGCRIGTEGGCAGATRGPQGAVYGDGLNGDFAKPVPGLGRWPANVLHDGSDEVLEAFAKYGESGSGSGKTRKPGPGAQPFNVGRGWNSHSMTRDGAHAPDDYGDKGTAARFFFSAKADADDRIGSKHPTVKPVQLMRWLVRLVTPKGGVVLDPFAGTGTTGVAAIREGMDAILIEREAEYVEDINRRVAMLSGLDTPLLAGAAR